MKNWVNDVQLYFGVIRRVGYTMTLGMLDNKRRSSLLSLYQVYNQQPEPEETTLADPFIIPKTDVFELLGNDQATCEGVYECGFGHTTEFELKVISNLVKRLNPKSIFEIGTFQGRTTLNMALNIDPDAKIITLDLPSGDLDSTQMKIEEGEVRYVKKESSGDRFMNHPMAYKIHQVFGDSATFSFSEYENSIDLAFIDGSHAYEYVLNDSQKILSIMRPGGLIIWHDYTNWPGVWTALNELYQTNSSYKNIKHIGGTSIAILEVA